MWAHNFDKGGRIYTVEKNLFNKWGWENCTAICKRMRIRVLLTHTQNQTQNGLKT